MTKNYAATIRLVTDLESIKLNRAEVAKAIQETIGSHLLEHGGEDADVTIEFSPTFAYSGVYVKGSKFGVGKADLDVPGYTPCPQFGEFPTFNVAMDKAETLNTEHGLTKEEAFRIVGSSMRKTV